MNKFTQITINSATFGEQNPLPDMRNIAKIKGVTARFEVGATVTNEEKQYFGIGNEPRIFPYKMQDDYTREKKPTKYNAVVLENAALKAVFLPDFGGKLWSLYDKKHKKDLLYTNTVVQPCNLALRNAWLSGGVEFNIGIKGHNPFTCSPMFCELIGDNAVRFYEYERIRGIAYSVTACLPEDSDVLYIRTRVENTSESTRFMYWWTNIAFPEKSTTRVVVPAHSAFYCSYFDDHYFVEKKPVPVNDGIDGTYSMNRVHAIDNFYSIPENEDKWVVAADPDGSGLLQYSDKRLKSRKLFLWGNSAGGRHWNEYLSESGQAYIEIQAGILNTQLEHIPMPAHEVWEWTEGYTYIDGANKALYGEWDGAIAAVKSHLNDMVKAKKAIAPNDLPSLKIEGEVKRVGCGSAFGALENKVREIKGELPISDYLDFGNLSGNGLDNSSGFSAEALAEVKDYNDLLTNGYIAYREPAEHPAAYINGEFWCDKLLESAKTAEGDHWYTYYQAGATAYALGKAELAKTLFEQSIKKQPSLWAYRCLGFVLLNEFNNENGAFECWSKAYNQPEAKTEFAFIKEYFALLAEYKKYAEVISLYNELSPEFKTRSRVLICYAEALLNEGNPEAAARIITPDIVLNDVKEGEKVLSNLWLAIYAAIVKKQFKGLSYEEALKTAEEKYPVPYSIDFRM